MKNSTIVAWALWSLIIVAVVVAIIAPKLAYSDVKPEAAPVIIYVDKPALSPAQTIWLAHLMQCESGIRKNAVLKVDLDGSSSLGLLQFKQGTFDSYKAKYGFTGEIFDGVTQVKIVTQWILHPGSIDWQWQFPDCVRKYGLPPQ